MTRVAVFGVGETATMLVHELHARDVPVVAVFSRTTAVGTHANGHFGVPAAAGVVVSAAPVGQLPAARADVALLATQSSLVSQLPLIQTCLDNGLDVLSLAEQGFYPPADEHELAAEVDRAARAAGRTVFFGGVQDAFWHTIPSALTAGSRQITRISGTSVSDLGSLGADTLAEYPLGLSAEEFADAVSATDPMAGIMMPAVQALVAGLGLTPSLVRGWVEPVFAKSAVHRPDLRVVVEEGRSSGLVERTVVETAEGIVVDSSFVSEFLGEDRREVVGWHIEGVPTLDVVLEDFPGHAVTSAGLVNRIPAVRAAAPGYQTVLDLPMPRWWSGADAATQLDEEDGDDSGR